MSYEIETREFLAQPTAVVREIVDPANVASWLAEAYAHVFDHLERLGIETVGPPFARYTFEDDGIDMEAGVGVREPVERDDPVEPSSLPPGTIAVVRHVGPFELLDHAFEAIEGWLHAQGCEPSGPHWEYYLTDPAQRPDPMTWETDLVVPYRPIGT